MPFSTLSSLGREAPLRIVLINACDDVSITMAGLAHPLRLAAKILGPEQLQVAVISLEQALKPSTEDLQIWPNWHIALLVADEEYAPLPVEQSRILIARCQQAKVWGAVGSAVLWLAQAGVMDGLRTALPWALYAETEDVADRAILTSNLFELDGGRLTCCGGTASIDFSLTLVYAMFGATVQAEVQESLCVDRIRGAAERQRMALQARFGVLQPRLSEAVMLMEANIEEPLATDDIANLVGISRRQLERQFKQYLGSVPSRYYLELRLRRARQLLLDSHHSIVQVGLMCGFSSGSHFSTAYGALFGITPRDERKRKLIPIDISTSR
jgi:transcriptional regulator GlxA family with amidase domain